MVFFRRAPRRRASSPTSDPWQLLRQYGDELAAAARDVLLQLDDAELMGVIVTPDATLGNELRALLGECRADCDRDRICVGIAPRARVTEILHDGFAATGETARAVHTVPQRLLPIVVATPMGIRIGSVPCIDRAEPA